MITEWLSFWNEFISSPYISLHLFAWYRYKFWYRVNWKRTLLRILNRKSYTLARMAHSIWLARKPREQDRLNVVRNSLRNETHSGMKVIPVSYKEILTSFYESAAFKIGYKNSHLPTEPGRPSFPLPHQNNTHQLVVEALITDCRVAPATDEKPIEGFLLPAKCQSAQPLPRQHQWPLPVRVPQISVGTVHYGPIKRRIN